MKLPHNSFCKQRLFASCIVFLTLALVLLSVSGCRRMPPEDLGVASTPAPLLLIPDDPAPPFPTPPAPFAPEVSAPPEEPTPIPAPEQFSIVWLADTQTIAYLEDDKVFQSMGEWIMSQQKPLNVRYIVQTGDLVDNGFQKKQWDSFNILLNQFYGKIPYLPIAGNHDLGVKWENYRGYLDRPFVKALPADHVFKRGRAVYAEFQAGGQDFLLLGAGWNADVASAVWMNGVLRAHPNHVAILMFHSYITAKGGLSYQGDDLRDLIVAKNPNVRLVLCGHLRGNGFRAEEFDDDGDGKPDRVVNAMLYNYQGYGHTNSGQIRMLTFDTDTRNLHVFTYSPFTQRYYRDDFFKSLEFDLKDAF